MEKRLPFSLEAEQGVLGSILIDAEAINQVADFLKPEDFYRDSHKTIYAEMVRLYEQHRPADSITLAYELEDKLEEGTSYLWELVNDVPTSGNVEYYARIVAHDAVCRRLIHAAGLIAAFGYERKENAVQLAEQVLFSVEKRSTASGFDSLQSIMLEYMNDLDRVHEKRGTIIGVPTGFTDIDKMLGGLQKTDLVILAARPSMGKSAMAMAMAHNAAKKDKKVAVFSLEMGKKQLAARLLAMDSKVDLQSLRNGWIDNDEWDSITASNGRLSELPIWINDTAGNPITSMRSQLRRLFTDSKPDLIIVDYLQLIDTPDDKKRRDNRVNEIGDITRGLKGIAKEFDVPVLALAQLSRAVEARQIKIPQLSDLRESGSIENDADVVMFLYRQDYYEEKEGKETMTRPNEADVIVAKHRNGPTGVVTLYFQSDQTSFHNLEKENGY